jgi:hypothetical protein
MGKNTFSLLLDQKFKKASVLNLETVLRIQKQTKKTFQKIVKMYLVPTADLKKNKGW